MPKLKPVFVTAKRRVSSTRPRSPAPSQKVSRPGKDRKLSLADVRVLNGTARDYAWVLFGIGQIAAMLNINKHVVTAIAAHPQSPFTHEKKARPEWVVLFLREPPKGFEPSK